MLQLRHLVGLLVLSVGVASAHALILTDTKNYGTANTGILLSITGTASTSDTFDLTPLGYNPTLLTVNSATATFILSDATGSNPETVQITLGSTAVANASKFSGSITLQNTQVGSVLGTLETTGALSFVITNTSGPSGTRPPRDFFVNKAELVADVGPRTPTGNVPDAGLTSGLVLLGLCGVAAMRRRKSIRSSRCGRR